MSYEEIIEIAYKEHSKINNQPDVKYCVNIYEDDSCTISNLSLPTRKKLFKKLINAHSIYFEKTEIYDISIFKNLYKVGLCSMSVTDLDISKLTNVQDLCLQLCPYIHNISYLKNLCKFSLLFNDNVSDLSNISHVKNICLYNCSNIQNFRPIKNVRELQLRDVGRVNFSFFTKLKYLTLHGDYSNYLNVKYLQNLKILALINISNIDFKDVLNSVSCDMLRIINCNITNYDISELTSEKIRHLSFCKCENITKMPIFDNIEELTINNCRNLSDVSNLNSSPNLKIINITESKKWNESSLSNIENVNIFNY